MLGWWTSGCSQGGKYHCYEGLQVTLCGKWQLLVRQPEGSFSTDEAWRYSATCEKCIQIFDAWKAKQGGAA